LDTYRQPVLSWPPEVPTGFSLIDCLSWFFKSLSITSNARSFLTSQKNVPCSETAMSIVLAPGLVSAVREERAILFLGAGASVGALHSKHLAIPDAEKLKDFLCDKFLGGELKKRSLPSVASYAINGAGILEIQSAIASLLSQFDPADFHKLIPPSAGGLSRPQTSIL
jgi:hypothetical protein